MKNKVLIDIILAIVSTYPPISLPCCLPLLYLSQHPLPFVFPKQEQERKRKQRLLSGEESRSIEAKAAAEVVLGGTMTGFSVVLFLALLVTVIFVDHVTLILITVGYCFF